MSKNPSKKNNYRIWRRQVGELVSQMCTSHWHLCLCIFPDIKGETRQLRLFKSVVCGGGVVCCVLFFFFPLSVGIQEEFLQGGKVEKIPVDSTVFFVCSQIQHHGGIKFSGCFESLIWKWENLIGFGMKITDTGSRWENKYYRHFVKYFNIIEEIFLWTISRTSILLGFEPFIPNVSILSFFEIYRESAKVATLPHNLLFENRQLGEQII